MTSWGTGACWCMGPACLDVFVDVFFLLLFFCLCIFIQHMLNAKSEKKSHTKLILAPRCSFIKKNPTPPTPSYTLLSFPPCLVTSNFLISSSCCLKMTIFSLSNSFPILLLQSPFSSFLTSILPFFLPSPTPLYFPSLVFTYTLSQ